MGSLTQYEEPDWVRVYFILRQCGLSHREVKRLPIGLVGRFVKCYVEDKTELLKIIAEGLGVK